MKKIETLRDMQKVSTYIYNDLNSFCVKNGLKVYLFGGSLIGAVRHKGYIQIGRASCRERVLLLV